MAVQTFQVDELNIKKEIDEEEEEELLPTDSVSNSDLEPIKPVKQEGDNWLGDNLKCEDESEDEKPDNNLLNTITKSECKSEDDSDSDCCDDKSSIFPTVIKTEPVYPVEERDVKINIDKGSSVEEIIPNSEDIKNGVNFSSFDVEESCCDIKKDYDSSKHDSAVEMPVEMPVERSNANDLPEKPPDTPQRKRKLSTDDSDDYSADPIEEFNNISPTVKRKRVHFAEESSIKSTRIFERAKKPVSFVPSNKEPGIGILKNKLPSGKTDDNDSAVSDIITHKKKVKTVKNRKEGKKTKSMSDTDIINEKTVRKNRVCKAKESSPTRGKKKKTLNKNSETRATTRITDFFNKKNKDPNKAQLDSREKTVTNETNGSSQVESLETINGKNQKKNEINEKKKNEINEKKKNEINEKKNNESQKENIVDCTTRNIYKHCQKRKSKEHYAFKCPVLAYLCICGAWCKSGPELNAHLSVCAKLQPRVVLTRLKL